MNRPSLFWIILLLFSPITKAQLLQVPNTGYDPTKTYDGQDAYKIELSTGSVNGQIPLATYPQLGSLDPVSYFIELDNPSYTLQESCDSGGSCFVYYDLATSYDSSGRQIPRGISVRSTSPAAGLTANIALANTAPNPPSDTYSYAVISYTFTDATGHSHLLLGDTSSATTIRAVDGSGYSATFPPGSNLFQYPIAGAPLTPSYLGVVYDSRGTKYSWSYGQGGASQFTAIDVHNNSIHSNLTGFSDSIGRSLPGEPQIPWQSNNTSQCPNLGVGNQPAYASTAISFPGVNGSQQQYLLCYVAVLVRPGYAEPVLPNVPFSPSAELSSDEAQPGIYPTTSLNGFVALQSVTHLTNGIPDSNYWGFVYDSSTFTWDSNGNEYISEAYGGLTKLIYPQGGTAEFGYGPLGTPFTTDVSSGLTGNPYGLPSTWYHSVASVTRNDGHAGTGITTYAFDVQNGGGVTSGDMTTTVTSPDHNATTHTFTDLYGDTNGNSRYETSTSYYQGTSPRQLLKRVTTQYQTQPEFADTTMFAGSIGVDNVKPSIVDTYASDGSRISEQRLSYPNQWSVQETECELQADSYRCYPIYAPGTTSLAVNVSAMHPSVVSLHDFATDQVILTSTTPEYVTSPSFKAMNLMDLSDEVQIFDTQSNMVSQTRYGYDGLGDLTSTSRWLNTTGQNLTTTTAYNSLGMPTSTTDGMGTITHINSYQCNGLFPLSVTVPYGSTTTVQETNVTNYDCATGAALSSTDRNGVLTQYFYNDPLGRPTQIKRAVGTPSENWTTASYPSMTQTDVAQDQNSPGDGLIKSTAITDGFGRVTQQIDPTSSIVDTSYNAVGEVASVSNPHGLSAYPTDGTTYFTYDALGRKTIETDQDGAIQQWCYNGIPTTGQANCLPNASATSSPTWTDMSDATGRHKQQIEDGFGNLLAVVEPNPQSGVLASETDYAYDALGNLLLVNQHGTGSEAARSRSFTYDSLSRLLTSTNPETGTICYGTWSGSNCVGGYDPNGNLLHKSDARGISLTYAYDGLNRIVSETSSNGSVWKGYGYDNSAYSPGGIGRLAWESTGTVAAGYYYDAMGRVLTRDFVLPSMGGVWGYTSAAYDLAGNLTDLIYPDGHHIQEAWDAAGHLCNVVDNTGSPISCTTNTSYPYFSSPTYTAGGALTGAAYGNGVSESHSYNSRLQPTEISVQNSAGTKYMDKQFCYGTATALCPTSSPSPNNGNILNVLNALNPSRSQGYSYDNLNRIAGFSNASMGMSQAFTIDSFGNMTVNSGTLVSNLTFDAKNRIDVNTNAGYAYDTAGNLILAPAAISGTQQYNYDASSQLVSIGSPASPSASYTYDARGARVRKDASSAWTEYVDFGGTPIAEKNSATGWSDYIFANGQRIARVDPTTNLVPYSQQFGNSGWIGYCGPTSNMTSNTADFTAPDGTNTATKFVEPAALLPCGASGVSLGLLTFVPGGLQAGQSYTASVWARGASGGESIVLGLNDCAEQSVTLNNSWQRYSVTFSTISSSVASCEGSRGFQMEDLYTPNATYYVWGAQTEQAASAGPYVATSSSTQTLHYYSADHLGTTTVVTDAVGNVQNDSDYYPFGAEVPIATADSNHYKFTGQERDSESGFDYFGARYYANSMGRFMSPDPSQLYYADQNNPQSFNLYSYVWNNPLTLTDPSGLTVWCSTKTTRTPGKITQTGTEPDGTPIYTMGTTITTTQADCVDDASTGVAGAMPRPKHNQVDPDQTRIHDLVQGVADETKSVKCAQEALGEKGISLALDGVGAVPGLGNLVSATAGTARAVGGVVTWGGGVVGAGMAISEKDATGTAFSGAGLGLAVADVSLGETKTIPLVGNGVSAVAFGYDAIKAAQAYKKCMAKPD